ncbi:hypothetical protein LCL97_21715 [Seohaeicola saemankumensis]|nr:hypothetical protein [Seohaeicola saemankumensis]MCA0873457.1 hypothetical protein [Seohaeicola saemankumensis]
MSDDLVYAIFKEIAVLEGKRTPDGEWTIDDANEVTRILTRAFAVVRRASTPREE